MMHRRQGWPVHVYRPVATNDPFLEHTFLGCPNAMGMLDTMTGAKVVFQLCETCFNAHCNGQRFYSEELEDFIRAA